MKKRLGMWIVGWSVLASVACILLLASSYDAATAVGPSLVDHPLSVLAVCIGVTACVFPVAFLSYFWLGLHKRDREGP